MKTYILLFLVSWFQYVNAPKYCQTYQNQNDIANTENKLNDTKEKFLDSLDIKTLKIYKMQKYFSKNDRKLIRDVCDSLGIATNHFYTIIKLESSGNKKAINKKSKAVGLIGFLPKTAKRLGTSTEQILEMSNRDQILLTYKYFKSVSKGKKLKGMCNVYLAVLYPDAVNKTEEYVIGKKGSYTVKWNKALDLDNDSIITVKDVKQYINTRSIALTVI